MRREKHDSRSGNVKDIHKGVNARKWQAKRVLGSGSCNIPKSGKCLLGKLAWDSLISIVFLFSAVLHKSSVKPHGVTHSSPKNWIPILKVSQKAGPDFDLCPILSVTRKLNHLCVLFLFEALLFHVEMTVGTLSCPSGCLLPK